MLDVQKLQELGVNAQEAIRRFSGNQGLYERFLLRFPQDDNFAQIGPALEAGNWEEALRAAHTLKGVAGNLSVSAVFEGCSRIVAAIRAEDYAAARAAYPAMAQAYEGICAYLRAF